ncbi:family 78 glycoside hydrolase catalytic domain [Chitinophaga sp. sic0106]|uniref:family 78 glycoside hydrolase catalytic domain n=1 Tax=Chitinophaga sp. sic0106 TaxID=2854785 RepID=UPI001C48A296|nr:family 78 glycoside hydrolase catalytic domain [Chitinophaga sp. sic0106]MBV7530189.1 family 78 glycoside hydrolase catalytic domain [Chitinophaga sp. sic0106]
MKRITFQLTMLLIGLCCAAQVFAQVRIQQLRCESLQNPAGIAVTTPRLSWQLQSAQRDVEQTAYQVLVASSKALLDKNQGDLWNSGVVQSDATLHIPYAGKQPVSTQQCFWKVKSWTNKGQTAWSAPATWSMGLLRDADWKAVWIGYDHASPFDSISQWSRLSARYFRKAFTTKGPVKRATVYVSGLGVYELNINGKRINSYGLTPAPTDFSKTVLYNTFDVTGDIKAANVISTAVGNGRYFTMRQNYKPAKHATYGFPKLILQLEIEYANGEKQIVATDQSWKLNVDGPIRTNNDYDGEEYDATKEWTKWQLPGFNDHAWLQPELVAAPEGKLTAQMIPPVKVMQTIKPVSIKQLSTGRYILDMGQNFAGWLRIKVNGKRGEVVTLKFAESLQPDGQLYVANLRDARVTDKYTLKGGGPESWQPTFVYHGFRYVEITGFPGTPTIKDFEGQVLYDDMTTTGTFECSDPIINAVHKNAWWGIASNYKGMPMDCPQRNERQPWLGDRATGAGGEAFLFNNAALYAKWLQDIEDAQTPEGSIPDVAPAYWRYYSDNITWPGTYLMVADMLYRQYGDQQAIVRHYPSMKKWMDYMKNKYLKNGIMTKDKYGDWCVPPENLTSIHSKDSTRTTNGQLLSTATYYYLLGMMESFATIAHQEGDIAGYQQQRDSVRSAFNNKFYRADKKYYDNNTVTANLLPLYFGMVPEGQEEAVFNSLYTKIKITDKMHISTGVIGTQWLLRGLSHFQRSDIAFTLAGNDTYPSWGYMVKNGATTIWELWNGNTANPEMNSQNHVMLLGDYLIWLYENLAGIKSDNNAIAFKHLVMKPENIDGLDFVKATYQSAYGTIASSWKKRIQQFSWQISIPANTSATVYIPANDPEGITESGKPLAIATGVRFLRMEGRYAVLELRSGTYNLVADFNFRKGIVRDEFIFRRASFPESHAATIAQTTDGLVAAWFGGTKEGFKDVCIWTSHFKDGTWTAPVMVADGVLNDSTRHACYNPVLYYTPSKELLLFYKIGPNVAGWTGWMMRSRDNGKTWSKREALPEGFLGPIKNKPVLLDGKLICPSSTEKDGWRAHLEITTDYGKTWTKTLPLNDGKTVSAIQPSLLTYADGRWQIMCRSKNRTINESWSTDHGKTWSTMTASSLPNNNSGTDAVTLKDGRQLLVYNHVKPAADLKNGKGARTPLNVAISKDGKNWSAALVLEDSPVSQYSYPSVIQTTDGLVHIVYTWRRERIKHIVVDPAKLELKPIVNEQWPGFHPDDANNASEE